MTYMKLLPLLAVLYFCLGAAACDEARIDAFPVKGQKCALSGDQASFYLNLVRTFPIKVSLDPRFSGGEQSSIVKAIQQWNLFSQASLGMDFFELQVPSPGHKPDFSNLPLDVHYCFKETAKVAGLLITRITSTSEWLATDEEEHVGAVTRRCSMGENGAQSEQIIVFNMTGRKDSLILAEALHELGHVLGLGHSCWVKKKDSKLKAHGTACTDVHEGHPYFDAVMYPELDASRGWAPSGKEVLHTNDMERAYCLYRRGI